MKSQILAASRAGALSAKSRILSAKSIGTRASILYQKHPISKWQDSLSFSASSRPSTGRSVKSVAWSDQPDEEEEDSKYR